ncbi:MAG TPA: intein-containing Rv2578c family radical SAM protein [Pseudonocardiaceae bacterium]|nr:intein-containing Rv2578c family radical SAM protein [Pseudonocardiaceae bacterium]
MRWDGQRVDEQAQHALPGISGLVRSVRTPEFNGLVFHEVMARSVLNKVPGASSMPFGWTVNPYRGCSHGCTYCLAGETPVLMADGRTKPISDLVVGDRIYGTRLTGRYRRYEATVVLAHWSTEKPAYRIKLVDGTELVTSGDHRFLTERGWKHVTGTTTGADRRPHLTTGNKLMGTGSFGEQPVLDADYRRGYLCGLLRGGGGAGYRDRVARFRLTAAPAEVAERASRFLAEFGVDAEHADAVPELLAWPSEPNDLWHKGFLAGVFDARGGRSSRVLRIRNADPEVVRAVLVGFTRFGFAHTVEESAKGLGPQVVRLNGGLTEHLRFFHTVDPADTSKRTIDGLAIKSGAALGVVSIEALNTTMPMYDITTGTGDFVANGVVSHNCFARNTHTYLDLDSGHDFDTQVVVKVNAVEVLTAQLRAKKWQREHVAMGTNTDPYQRAEGRYALMPGIIGALARSGTPMSILTKGTVLSRDIPLLAAAAKDVPVGLGVSIALIDREIQRDLEPGTPSPQARLELVRRVREAGLPCGVFVAPVLPMLTDSVDRLDRLFAAIAEAGATGVTVLPLHLRPGAREWFAAWLRREHPELAESYRKIYGRGSYADRSYRRLLAQRVGPLLRRHGLASGTNRSTDEEADTDAAEPIGGGAGESDPDRAVWPAGSLPAGAPKSALVDQAQLTLL